MDVFPYEGEGSLLLLEDCLRGGPSRKLVLLDDRKFKEAFNESA